MRNNHFIQGVIYALLTATGLYADITGNVWQDLPLNGTAVGTYGVKTSNEPGIQGVIVRAYDSTGALTNSVVTDASGNYTLPTGAGAYRVEFTWPGKTWLYPSPDLSNTSIQFANDGATNVNFSLHAPENYCTANPDMASVLMINGGASNPKKSISL